MSRKNAYRGYSFGIAIGITMLLLLLVGGAGAVPITDSNQNAYSTTIDDTNRTVTTSNIFIGWSNLNINDPEEIDILNWNSTGLTANDPNLTMRYPSSVGCNGGDVEYFGNSWAQPDPQSGGKVLVGAGTKGTWTGSNDEVKITSNSTDCSNSAGITVNTTYKFLSPNTFKVIRNFEFTTPFNLNFRPYIPRLFPAGAFSQTLHPDFTGTNLVTEENSNCELGCNITNWNGNNATINWFAIHDPVKGQGVIVRRIPSAFPVTLWVDQDGGSSTAASSVLALQPNGGFTGTVTEEESFCFYDKTTWTPSLTLPSECTLDITPTPATNGLNARYYATSIYANGQWNNTGTPTATQIDPNINLNWQPSGTDPRPTGIGAGDFSADWNGYINISADGNYTFATSSDDGSIVYIDNNVVVNNPIGYNVAGAPVALTTGLHPITVKYYECCGDGSFITLFWTIPGGSQAIVPQSALFTTANLTSPIISNLTPENNTHFGSNNILFSWNTQENSTTEVYLKSQDEINYTHYAGDSGLSHTFVIDNLTRNKWYNYYVSSGSATSEQRSFYIDNGIEFSQKSYNFTIDRDYSQLVSVSVINTDSKPHTLLVSAYNPYNDLIFGFIGNGSQDQEITLNPGESKDVTLSIFAQDAMLQDYSFPITLNSTDSSLYDSAMVNLKVRQPNINYTVTEIGADPYTLAKTFSVTNNGDRITDFSIFADGDLANKVLFHWCSVKEFY